MFSSHRGEINQANILMCYMAFKLRGESEKDEKIVTLISLKLQENGKHFVAPQHSH